MFATTVNLCALWTVKESQEALGILQKSNTDTLTHKYARYI